MTLRYWHDEMGGPEDAEPLLDIIEGSPELDESADDIDLELSCSALLEEHNHRSDFTESMRIHVVYPCGKTRVFEAYAEPSVDYRACEVTE